VAYV
jgi:ATP-binding cassette subfamily C (CFTR/MRP) protein 1